MELILSALPPSAFAIVVQLFTLAYFFVTTFVMRNKPGRLWIPALILLIEKFIHDYRGDWADAYTFTPIHNLAK